MGGGGFLSDWQKEVPLGWLKQLLIAKLFGKKTMLYGIGAGPFITKKGKLITKVIINKFADKVTVRDELSKDWLEKCGIKENKIVVTGDQAILMKKVYDSNLIEFKLPSDKNNIGVIVAPYLKGRNKERYKSLKKSLITFLKTATSDSNNNVILIPFQSGEDLEYCFELQKEVKGNINIIDIPGDHLLVNNLLEKLDILISLRLHGNILAANMNIPFIPIIYHHKTYEFLRKLGWNHYCEFGDGINWRLVDLDSNKLINKMNFFLKEKKELKKELKSKISKYQMNESKNIEVLKNLINKKI